ncbi:DDE transposase family protein [Parabacteroides goldsteinii]|uniref:DDE transposase family protein n=1 Tax=Parabacteroides goldsteinii TaxID=328812 RepID=UPI001CCCAFEB|nr:DDE transposase family protein [Parabacteroides goldsteinii]UBD75702.1 DDE transposase family protein [Parabacteroides goldsteinii]
MAKELSNKQKKDWAKMLFVKEHLTQKEIAERVGISTVTMTKWVKVEKWEVLKTSLSVTREEQLANFYRQIAEINNNIANREPGLRYASAEEANMINKLATAIEKMEKETGISDIISVSKDLLDWLRKTDIDKAKELSNYFDAYIKDRLK